MMRKYWETVLQKILSFIRFTAFEKYGPANLEFFIMIASQRTLIIQNYSTRKKLITIARIVFSDMA